MFFPEIMVKQVLYYWRPCSKPKFKSNYQNQFHVTWKCVEKYMKMCGGTSSTFAFMYVEKEVEVAGLLGVGGEM